MSVMPANQFIREKEKARQNSMMTFEAAWKIVDSYFDYCTNKMVTNKLKTLEHDGKKYELFVIFNQGQKQSMTPALKSKISLELQKLGYDVKISDGGGVFDQLVYFLSPRVIKEESIILEDPDAGKKYKEHFEKRNQIYQQQRDFKSDNKVREEYGVPKLNIRTVQTPKEKSVVEKIIAKEKSVVEKIKASKLFNKIKNFRIKFV